MATCGSGGTHIWNLAENGELLTADPGVNLALRIAFSPCGIFLAMLKWNGVQLLDIQKHHVAAILPGDPAGSRYRSSLAYSPDGRYIAFGAEKNTIQLVNLKNYKQQTLKGHTDEIVSLSFSADSKKTGFMYLVERPDAPLGCDKREAPAKNQI